jgi:ethanolamine utilization protein EutN
MQIGKVVGHATSTVKHPTLNGWRLLIVQMLTPDDKPDGEPVLVIDSLGAGTGARVIATTDALLVRELVGAKNSPIRWSVMGITDE